MSVLVKGMRMPKGADEYRLIIRANGQVIIDKKSYWEEAEAVPVPPHGRLVDGDALMQRFEKEEMAADEHGRDFSFSFKSGGENCAEWWSVQRMLMDAPTVIEAEGGE